MLEDHPVDETHLAADLRPKKTSWKYRIIFILMILLCIPISMAWFSTSYNKRITYNYSAGSTLNGSIFVVNNGSFDGSVCTSNTCDDLIFVNSSDNTQISREFGNLTAPKTTSTPLYVCVDSVNLSGTDAYAYYSRVGATAPANTLSQCNSYAGVFHFDDKESPGKESVLGVNNMTMNDCGISAIGKYGSSLRLNSEANYPTITNPVTSPYISIEAWIYADTSAVHILANKDNVYYFYFMDGDRTLQCGFVFAEGGSSAITTGTVFEAGKWYHVGCTFNGTAETTYVNGEIDQISVIDGSKTLLSDSTVINIGTNSGAAQKHVGYIDELRIDANPRDAKYYKAQYLAGVSERFGIQGAEETNTPPNTCTYSTGDWNVNCADACNITSNVNVGASNVYFNGTGTVKIIGANITAANATITGGCWVEIYGGELKV